jgi:hypothetical protein
MNSGPTSSIDRVPGSLVVDTSTLSTAFDGLTKLNISWSEIEISPELGLALFRGLADVRGPVTDTLGLIAAMHRAVPGDQQLGTNLVSAPVGLEGTKPMSAGTKPMSGDPEPVPADFVAQDVDDPTAPVVGILDVPLPDSSSLRRVWPRRAGHSAMVASLVRAAAAGGVQVQVRGVLHPSSGSAELWDTAVALVELANSGIDVLNLSFGCYTGDDKIPLLLDRALKAVPERVLVVTSAGNHGEVVGWVNGRTRSSNSFPGADKRVIAVGAHDEFGQRADFSPDLDWVDCTAPGVDVTGAYLNGLVQRSDGPTEFTGGAKWSGTSFAAATVSGAVAAQMKKSAGSTPREAFAAILGAPGSPVRPAR